MPRSKNPKPQQLPNDELEDGERSALLCEEDATAIEEKDIGLQPSLSPSSLTQNEKRETEETGLIVSQDGRDNTFCEESSSTPAPLLASRYSLQLNGSPGFSSSFDTFSDNMGPKKKSGKLRFTEFSEDKIRRVSSGAHHPDILSWLRKRFTLKENAKTSASQVIKLYEKEFQGETNVPLQSYQVGQSLRRIFPDLKRCKITVNGKRVWVYRHLSAIDNYDEEISTAKMDSNTDAFSNQQRKSFNGVEVPKDGAQQQSFRPAKNFLTHPDLRNERRSVKHSTILYNLLYPQHGGSGSEKSFLTNEGSSVILNNNTRLFQDELTKSQVTPPNLQKDDNIIQWLRENYEYADGYYVKSMDVLQKYNRDRKSSVKYLSQVGRVIKYVFPDARHHRRSLKGGKREWVYHNLRSKDRTDDKVWKGAPLNFSRVDTFSAFDSRPSMVALQRYARKEPGRLLLEEGPSAFLSNNNEGDHRAQSGFSTRDRDNASSRESVKTESDAIRSEDGALLSQLGTASGHSTPSSNSPGDFSNILCDSRHRNNNELHDEASPGWISFDQAETEAAGSSRSLNTFDVPKRSYLEMQIDRIKSEKRDMPSTFGDADVDSPQNGDGVEDPDSRVDSCDQAEDLSVSVDERLSGKESQAHLSQSLDPSSVKRQQEESMGENIDSDDTEKYTASRDDHDYTFSQIVDPALRAKDLTKPYSKPCPIKEIRHGRLIQGLSACLDPSLPAHHPSISSTYNPLLHGSIQWEDLSMCGAHRYGWTLTPTTNHDVPCNYIEWVLFEGQLLRDGQRVFRELKIYDDWSVSIHAMGRKVFPDELGGITDLTRTKESVSKVFSTLSDARSCRGLPALCLSDLCVHGVVVAKSEVWSSRENECEELRHRAINCQVLYRGDEDACPKCCRVIRMHTPTNTARNNGFTEKGAARFGSRPHSSL